MTTGQNTGGTTRRSTHSGQSTYIHELDDWPKCRWDPEAVTGKLERASALVRGMLLATELTVRNLTYSAVASSRIEGENPDPVAIRESIVR